MFLKSGLVFYYTGIGDYIYFLTNQFRGILSWNYKEDAYSVVTEFSEELCENGNPLFGEIIGCHNELYLLPDAAEDIYVYNLDEKRLTRLHVSLKNDEWKKKEKYVHGVVYGNNLYCISVPNPTYVVEINIRTRKYSVYYFDNITYTKEVEKKGQVYPIDCLTVINRDIVLPYTESKILKFDMMRKTSCSIEMSKLNKEPSDDYILGAAGMDWNDYWIYSACGRVYRIRNGVTQEWKIPATPDFMEKTKYGDNNEPSGFRIGYLILSDGMIYFISWSDYKILKYNIESERFSLIKNPYVKDQASKAAYENARRIGESQILLYSYYEYAFYLFDTEKEIFTKSTIQLSEDDVRESRNGFLFKNIFLTDDLEMLIEYTQANEEVGGMNPGEALIGNQIWEQL